MSRLSRDAVALSPTLSAMYGLYWLEKSGIWSVETPHRDKLTILIVAGAMLLSFTVHSALAKRSKG